MSNTFTKGPAFITADPITVTWANRNRLAEAVDAPLSWSDADQTPEDGQTTVIEVLDPTGTIVVTTHSGLAGTSFDVPLSSFGAHSSGWLSIGAERDGYREWEAYRIQVILTTLSLGTFTLTGNAARIGPLVGVGAGAFALSGSAAQLSVATGLSAGTGSFALTGNNAGLLTSITLAAGTGSFALTGVAATLTPKDPFFANVVLLLGFEGVDGATSTADESSSAKTVTFVGNAQLDTADKKFGTSSLLLDGTGDYLRLADSLDWQLGAANSDPWTVEAFVKWNALDSTHRGIMGQGATSGWALTGSSTIGELAFVGSNFTTVTTSGASMTTGVWYHCAADKDASGKVRVYVDGVMRGSATPANSAIVNLNQSLVIGAQADGGTVQMNGWLDEVRITKGVARFASDSGFTVPASAFPRS